MRFLIAAFFCIFSLNISVAQDSVSVRYLGIDDGLSNNLVRCIYQDHNEFMWFGTYDGLNKYDGSSFRVFRDVIGDTTSLLDNHIYSIDSDFENNIWVGGPRGVSIYNAANSRFTVPFFRKTSNNKTVSLKGEVLTIKYTISYWLAPPPPDLLFFQKTVRQANRFLSGELKMPATVSQI